MRTFLIYWLPVVAWMTLIFIMSTNRFSMGHTARFIEPMLRLLFRKISRERLVIAHMRIREGAHFAEYVILGLLLFRAVRGNHAEFWQVNWMWISLLITVGYAVLDELHQKWESGRTAKLKHVMIDIAGGVAAQLLLLACLLVKPN
jgi:VanZ family protein